MKPTKVRLIMKDFSALSFGDIQIKTTLSSEARASRPRSVPESTEDFNVHSDGPANAPSARDPDRETHRALSPISATPNPVRVLVVDDERSIRESLAKVLSSEGYEVRVAEDGRQALMDYQPNRTDLVLLDLKMPVQNGWDALDQMIALNPHQAIIIMTGRSPQSSWAGLTGTGALIEKPIDMSGLLDCMKRVLSEPRSDREKRVQIQHRMARFSRPFPSSGPREGYRWGGINE
ncbi:MAG: response regulator [Limisphaerales bacterium]